MKNEARLTGHGVSTCATCDGFFFKGKELIVVGGGDSAMEEATFLTKFATKVSIVHRRDKLRASKIMQDRAVKNEKITFVWNSVVEDILGNDVVTGVRVKNLVTGKTTELPCAGVFVAIGHRPNTALFSGQVDMDAKGYIRTNTGNRHKRARRLRRRRCAGLGISSGGHCSRLRLYGRHRRRTIS